MADSKALVMQLQEACDEARQAHADVMDMMSMLQRARARIVSISKLHRGLMASDIETTLAAVDKAAAALETLVGCSGPVYDRLEKERDA